MTPIFTSIINRLVPYIPKSVPEGGAGESLLMFFSRLIEDNPGIQLIAETGFNTGGSSRAFLSARSDTRVVSFDIGEHTSSVQRAKADIDRLFPDRHELVLGDSTRTLPAYAEAHPGRRFDLIFVDGGHDYEVAKADLLNFRAMSHVNTIVIIDDLTPWWVWGEGPTRVWQEAISEGWITDATLFKNGQIAADTQGRGSDAIWGVACYTAPASLTERPV
jgi:hypothetical protein